MGEVGVDGGGEIVEDVAVLLAAGFDHCEHRFHKAAAAGALRAKGKLAPNDGVTQGALARVVGRLDPFLADESPKPCAMLVQFLTHADQRGVAALNTAQQQAFHLRCSYARFFACPW